MRLTQQQIELTRNTVAENYGSEARVWLFGSQLDDSAIGGDVDLLIELDNERPLKSRLRTQALLESRLGVPVDLVLSVRDDPSGSSHIANIAKLTGLAL